MQALEFWKAVTMDHGNLIEGLIGTLEEHDIDYCVIGGQAVNAYVEPVVTLGLDLVVSTSDLVRIEEVLGHKYRVERFPHSLNVTIPNSNVRVQFQTDDRYPPFLLRSSKHEVLGVTLPVAHIEDLLQGKVWAFADESRRPSKRQKDLADISRILESFPQLKDLVPQDILDRLV